MTARKVARAKLLSALLIGLLAAFSALVPWSLDWMDPWEAKTWDWRAALMATPGRATDDIRLILLDQNSLDWALKENGLAWPWPRELYGAIVRFCHRAGARAVAFDVLFTEPSTYGQADDESLGRAAADLGRFAGTVFLGRSSGSTRSWPAKLRPSLFQIQGLSPWLADRKPAALIFPRATLPIEPLAAAAAVLANVHLEPDPDGTYRRVKLFGVFDQVPLPSLGIGAFLAADPTAAAAISPGRLVIGDRQIPIDPNGNAVLRYRGPAGTYRAYSAAAVLQSEIRIREGKKPGLHGDVFKNKYVLFGFSAPGLYDLRSAAVGGIFSGVEIQATMLDNFLSGDFMRRVPAGPLIGLVVVLSLFCALSVSVLRRPLWILAAGTAFAAVPILLGIAFYAGGFWLPIVVMESAVTTSAVLALALNYATEGRQKRFIKSAFAQYLSPAVIEELLQDPGRLKLGGERRTLSIFFSDLQGFTSISEGLEPEALTLLLNDYLTAMTDIIHEEGGTVDKYEGDAIISFWNAPLPVSDHAVRVVRAALRCQARLAERRPQFKARIGKELLMRIGINTGPAVVGNLGSHTRFDYTMLGDAVNLAARLEGINKQFGTYTMISQTTRDLIDDRFAVRELGRVAVVGKKEAVTVYEPMFYEDFTPRQNIYRRFAEGLGLFYDGRFEGALDVFEKIRCADPPAEAYAQKCREFIAAAPPSWSGVWVMSVK